MTFAELQRLRDSLESDLARRFFSAMVAFGPTGSMLTERERGVFACEALGATEQEMLVAVAELSQAGIMRMTFDSGRSSKQ